MTRQKQLKSGSKSACYHIRCNQLLCLTPQEYFRKHPSRS